MQCVKGPLFTVRNTLYLLYLKSRHPVVPFVGRWAGKNSIKLIQQFRFSLPMDITDIVSKIDP